MISGILRGKESDMRCFEYELHEVAAHRTDERLEVVFIKTREQFDELISGKVIADIICIDVTIVNGVEEAELLRSSYPKAVIIIMADTSVSPILYMKPSIMAASLILRPYSADDVHAVINEIFEKFIVTDDDEEVFVIDSRDDKYRIPLADILFFESRQKKIYACTEGEEYGFYDTMDNLEEKMNDNFIRCHRGYLVNKHEIDRIMISKNELYLKNDICLPVSRSYKAGLKELGI